MVEISARRVYSRPPRDIEFEQGRISLEMVYIDGFHDGVESTRGWVYDIEMTETFLAQKFNV